MGTLVSAACSQITKSTGHLETFCFHWPPMIGVVCTFPIWTPANVGGFDQSRWPTGVSTVSVAIAAATLALFLGSPLAFNTAAATSNRARLAPVCWFHCLPEACSYPLPRSFELMPVSEDVYGQVGAQ